MASRFYDLETEINNRQKIAAKALHARAQSNQWDALNAGLATANATVDALNTILKAQGVSEEGLLTPYTIEDFVSLSDTGRYYENNRKLSDYTKKANKQLDLCFEESRAATAQLDATLSNINRLQADPNADISSEQKRGLELTEIIKKQSTLYESVQNSVGQIQSAQKKMRAVFESAQQHKGLQKPNKPPKSIEAINNYQVTTKELEEGLELLKAIDKHRLNNAFRPDKKMDEYLEDQQNLILQNKNNLPALKKINDRLKKTLDSLNIKEYDKELGKINKEWTKSRSTLFPARYTKEAKKREEALFSLDIEKRGTMLSDRKAQKAVTNGENTTKRFRHSLNALKDLFNKEAKEEKKEKKGIFSPRKSI